MKTYWSIPSWKQEGFHDHCISFEKYDGSNLRFYYDIKSGWCKFGTKTRLFDKSDTDFGCAINIFFKTHAEGLEKIFKDKYPNHKNFTVFFEFLGKNSFAGLHDPNDEKELVLIDVDIFKKGIILPKEFIKNFEHLNSAKVVYEGKFDIEFIKDVQEGNYPVNEGIVAKGFNSNKSPQHSLWFAKVKTNVWLEKLKIILFQNNNLNKILEDNLKEQK